MLAAMSLNHNPVSSTLKSYFMRRLLFPAGSLKALEVHATPSLENLFDNKDVNVTSVWCRAQLRLAVSSLPDLSIFIFQSQPLECTLRRKVGHQKWDDR